MHACESARSTCAYLVEPIKKYGLPVLLGSGIAVMEYLQHTGTMQRGIGPIGLEVLMGGTIVGWEMENKAARAAIAAACSLIAACCSTTTSQPTDSSVSLPANKPVKESTDPVEESTGQPSLPGGKLSRRTLENGSQPVQELTPSQRRMSATAAQQNTAAAPQPAANCNGATPLLAATHPTSTTAAAATYGAANSAGPYAGA